MASIVIIGNGYDVYHKLKTKYTDFKEWIERKYQVTKTDFFNLPECFIDDKGETDVSDIEVAQMLYNIYENMDVPDSWGSFEDNLLNIDFNDLLDKSIILSEHNIDDFTYYIDEVDSKSIGIRVVAEKIKSIFSEWINSIEIDVNSTTFEKWLRESEENLVIINFNYTNTMERLGFNNVNHIHGKANDNSYLSSIVVGFGQDYFPINYEYPEESDIMDDIRFNNCNNINVAMTALHKNVKEIIRKNDDLWINIHNLVNSDSTNRIIVFGWSHSDSDQEYVSQIIKCIRGSTADLYLYDYKDTADTFADIWKSKGYNNGAIYKYRISNDKVDVNIMK